MSEENKPEATEPTANQQPENQQQEAAPPASDLPPGTWGYDANGNPNPPPSWEYRTNMKVTERLKEVVNLTIDVSKAEIARCRRQIDKLTYGS